MAKYFAKRTFFSLISLFIVISSVFLLLRLLPVEGYFGNRSDVMNEDNKQAVLKSLGLLDPWYKQLGDFYGKLFQGDFGRSIVLRPKAQISRILNEKIPYSLTFGLISIGISLVGGCGLGILMARHKGKFWDRIGTGYIVVINAVPPIIYYLIVQLGITGMFPIPMLFTPGKPLSYLLPAVCMSLGPTASYAMWIRRFMVDELNKDYIKLARAKGMKNSTVMMRHVVRNAFVPMAQYLPSTILYTISGSIYVEALFSIPGTGGLLVDAIQRQDNTLVQALVLIYSAIGVVGLLLGDVLMAVCDPRIVLNKKEGGSR